MAVSTPKKVPSCAFSHNKAYNFDQKKRNLQNRAIELSITLCSFIDQPEAVRAFPRSSLSLSTIDCPGFVKGSFESGG